MRIFAAATNIQTNDMDIINTQLLPLSKIEKNTGQIEGLPKNPRQIKDADYRRLVQSITDNPEMLSLRELLVYPHGGKYVIIGGNMRFEALRELGYKEAPAKVIPASATVEQLRAYTLKDNGSFGDWDFDLLANEWELSELEAADIDMSIMQQDVQTEPDEEGKAALELGAVKDETTLSIKMNDSVEYANVVDAIMAFNADLRLGLLQALGL